MIEMKMQQEIYLVAGGYTEIKNGQVGQHKTTGKVATVKARYETQCLTAGEDVKWKIKSLFNKKSIKLV